MVTFTVEEYANVRESVYSQGEGAGRQRERDDMGRRLAEIRRSIEGHGGTYRIPVFEPIPMDQFCTPAKNYRDLPSIVVAEFTVAQIKALETLFCGSAQR